MPKRTSKRTASNGPAAKRAAAAPKDDDAYDSDEPPPPVQDAVSSYRLDPEESLSDWTVEIVVDGTTHSTYHVHKQNLAVGPRRSEYFVKIFSGGGRFAESRDNKSRIELEELNAKYFPELLDYAYEGKLQLKTENSTALDSMAKYFDMRRLRWEAKQFWQKDIQQATTCGTYYEHARMLKDDKILNVAVATCSENIMNIDTSSLLVHS